jgi:serine protease Do
VEPLTAQLATRLGVERGTQGVVVTGVDPAGPAAQEGVQAGDVIVNVDRVPVRSAGDLRGAVQRAGERPVLVLLQRGDQSFFVTVQPRS